MNPIRRLFLLPLLLSLTGCAGGWRGGVAPAEWSDAPARTATATATPAAASGATTADGTVFTWKGEGASVALAGEFNSWSTSADPMAKQADGSWRLVKKLEPGRYMYKFVVDGTNWKPDPNAAESADDGFGGMNSVVVVGSAGSVAPAAPAAAAPPAAAKPAVVTGRARAPVVAAAGVTFTFAGAARSVSLCGDFNQWAPIADPMKQQADGTWTLQRKLPAGRHAYKFLVDGAQWRTDEANPLTVDDGFGGKNSIVVVK